MDQCCLARVDHGRAGGVRRVRAGFTAVSRARWLDCQYLGRTIGSVSTEVPPKLRALARNQAGVVSRQQALSSGLTRGMIDTKVRFARWRQVHRGVYATFTGPVTRDAQLWAAVLYAGQGAYLSHRTAAEINRLTDAPSLVIDVTVPASRRVIPPKGVAIHMSSRKAMVWRPPGIPPYTIAEETVIDLVRAAAQMDDVIALVTSGFNRRILTETTLQVGGAVP